MQLNVIWLTCSWQHCQQSVNTFCVKCCSAPLTMRSLLNMSTDICAYAEDFAGNVSKQGTKLSKHKRNILLSKLCPLLCWPAYRAMLKSGLYFQTSLARRCISCMYDQLTVGMNWNAHRSEKAGTCLCIYMFIAVCDTIAMCVWVLGTRECLGTGYALMYATLHFCIITHNMCSTSLFPVHISTCGRKVHQYV